MYSYILYILHHRFLGYYQIDFTCKRFIFWFIVTMPFLNVNVAFLQILIVTTAHY